MDLDVIEDVEGNEIDDSEDMTEKSSDIDMSKICSDYDIKTGKCLNEDSPYFVMECFCNIYCKYKKQLRITRLLLLQKRY